MANLEDTPAWQAILPLLSQMSIPDLAKKMNVPPGELAVALRRTGTSRVAARLAGGAGEPDEADGDDEPPVSRPAPAAASAQSAKSPKTAEKKPDAHIQGSSHRPSKLDRHRGLIGAMPDAAVAAKVGMSIQAVRNYRQKHGIAAAGRRRTPEELGIPSAVPLSSATMQHSTIGGGSGWAWRVVFASNPPRILLAEDAVGAAARAQASGYGAVTLIERLHEAL